MKIWVRYSYNMCKSLYSESDIMFEVPFCVGSMVTYRY